MAVKRGRRKQMWVSPSFDEAIKEWQERVKRDFKVKPSTVRLTDIISEQLLKDKEKKKRL